MTTGYNSRVGNAPEEGIKAPVKTSTTAAITLDGLQTINGYVLADNDRVLVKDQLDPADNGVYICKVNEWQRAPDFSQPEDVINGALVVDANTGIIYQINVNGFWNPGATDVTFTEALTPSGTPTISWGDILGDIVNQTDLNTALAGKEDAFTKATAFNKNFGTIAGTVAEGNHVHVKADITDFSDADYASAAFEASATAHIGDSSIHYAMNTIDHLVLQNIGINTHAQIDTHINSAGSVYTLDTGVVDGTIPVIGAGNLLPASIIPPMSINDLTDVTIATASDNQTLQYNSTSGFWENRTDVVFPGIVDVATHIDLGTFVQISNFANSYLKVKVDNNTTGGISVENTNLGVLGRLTWAGAVFQITNGAFAGFEFTRGQVPKVPDSGGTLRDIIHVGGGQSIAGTTIINDLDVTTNIDAVSVNLTDFLDISATGSHIILRETDAADPNDYWEIDAGSSRYQIWHYDDSTATFRKKFSIDPNEAGLVKVDGGQGTLFEVLHVGGNQSMLDTFVTTASTINHASLNIPHGVAPITPVNGDAWTTTAGLFVQINGATVGPLGVGTIGGSITDNQIAVGSVTADSIEGNADFTFDVANRRLLLQGDTVGSHYPEITLRDNFAGVDAKAFSIVSVGGEFGVALVDDSYGNVKSVLSVTRSGTGASMQVDDITAIASNNIYLYANNASGPGAVRFGINSSAVAQINSLVAGTPKLQFAQANAEVGFIEYSSGALQISGTGGINAASRLITSASTATESGFNIPEGVAPTTPVNGDFWTTTTGVFARINGATVDLTATGGTIGGSITDNQVAVGAATANDIEGSANFTYDGTTVDITADFDWQAAGLLSTFTLRGDIGANTTIGAVGSIKLRPTASGSDVFIFNTNSFTSFVPINVSDAVALNQRILKLEDTGSGTDISFITNVSAGAYNPISVAGDAVIVAEEATIDTSALTLIPWATHAVGIRMESTTDTLNIHGAGGITLNHNALIGTDGDLAAWGAGPSVMQLGKRGSVYGEKTATADSYAAIAENVYFDGTSVRHIDTKTASRYVQAYGQHYFFSNPSAAAGSVVTDHQVFFIDADGSMIGKLDNHIALELFQDPAVTPTTDVLEIGKGRSDGTANRESSVQLRHYDTGVASAPTYSGIYVKDHHNNNFRGWLEVECAEDDDLGYLTLGTRSRAGTNLLSFGMNFGTDIFSWQKAGTSWAQLTASNFDSKVRVLTPASATSGSGLRLPHGAAPTSPVNGDVWTTTAGLFARINGSTVGPFGDLTPSEATWQPTISDGTNNATSYTLRDGYYYRIGDLVFVSGRVRVSNFGSVSGALRISSLPFTVDSLTYPSMNVGHYQTAGTGVRGLGGFCDPSTSHIRLRYMNSSGTTLDYTTTLMGTATIIYFDITYRTSDA